MRRGARPARLVLASLLLAPLAVLRPADALAQTTVNPGALDQLAPPPPGEAAPAKSPAAKPAPRHPTPKPAPKPSAKAAPHPAKPAAPAPPVVPKAAPPAPVLPPPIVVPTRPAPPATRVPEATDAPGAVTARSDGLSVTFGVGRADLNPASEAAIRALAHPQAPGTTTYSVTAYAGGNADDPSTPRRLSLSRALAVRSLLLAEGVASPRIYVRALGEPPLPETASPDRVDVVVATTPLAPAAGPASAAAPASAPAPATTPAWSP